MWLNLVAMAAILSGTSLLWWGLAAVMVARTDQQEDGLQADVAELWGQPLDQSTPRFQAHIPRVRRVEEPVYGPDGAQVVRDGVLLTTFRDEAWEEVVLLPVLSSRLDVSMHHDPRRKGLIWFSLYDVAFDGTWTTRWDGAEPVQASLTFPFPQGDGMYDDFRFEVDGAPVTPASNSGQAVAKLELQPGQTIAVRVAYRSRGRDSFTYRPVEGWMTGDVQDFTMALHTDFDDIDFPGRTLSPAAKAETDAGWTLTWRFERLVTGAGMGMLTPTRVQPGELAAKLAFTAPISLALFTLWVSALGLLRGVRIHPINHAFIAGAFFSFHLLFAYTSDHLPIEAAFALSSVISVLLTVSYLRLVAGARFALVQAGGAQLLYQVVFSLAHMQEGMTGLTLTFLLVATLFALMQLTGRIQWDEVLREKA